MINFIINWSDNRFKTLATENRRSSYGVISGIIGLGSNLLLAIMKLLIGLFSGSVSIMADALNSVTDTFSSILTLVGFKIAAKDPDQNHPYGHQRFEYISGLFISILLLFVGLQFLQSSIQKIFHPQSIKLSALVFLILGGSIIIKLWQHRFYQKVGQHIDSETLIATAKDSLMDVLTTTAILISGLIYQIWHWNIDGWVGGFVAIYISISGLLMLRDFVNELMGKRPSAHAIGLMTSALERYPEILGFHDLTIHSYGPNRIFATVDVEMDSHQSLDQAHEVIEAVEHYFKTELAVTLDCHIDAIDLKNHHYHEIYQAITRIIRAYDLGLHTHDFHVAQKTGGEEVQFDIVVPEDLQIPDGVLLKHVTRDLKAEFPELAVAINFDHHYVGKDKRIDADRSM